MGFFCFSRNSTAVRSSLTPSPSRRSFRIPLPLRRSFSGRSTEESRRKSSADVRVDVRSHGGSSSCSTYLLKDTSLVGDDYNHDRASALVTAEDRRRVDSTTSERVIGSDDGFSVAKATRSCDQVVELRVSIHCKGCERKVKDHISKIEGVTSYSIDLEKKKVTVVGDVTPTGILSSVSKIKTAQFWASTPSSVDSVHPHHHP